MTLIPSCLLVPASAAVEIREFVEAEYQYAVFSAILDAKKGRILTLLQAFLQTFFTDRVGRQRIQGMYKR